MFKSSSGGKDVSIVIPRYRGWPIVMIQDSKHGTKTYRNNLFSGAHLLVLGDFTVSYNDVHEIASANASPLYKRDVEKLDRQDDNAATRLFSAETLRFTADNFPNKVGLVVFLFVFGELSDAYQSRKLSHSERLKMAFRAHFFLDAWETYLKQTGYKPSLYLLSRQALDIIRYIINGLISLVIVYRDHLRDKFPLFPWLHSTEACEHVFGEARQLVADFTHLDFVFMIDKLCIRIREAILRSETRSEPHLPGQGYCHTYFDSVDVDFGQLKSFPSTAAITKLANLAAHEADNLINLLGVSPKQLWQPMNLLPILPSLSSWAPPSETDRKAGNKDDSDVDSESEDDGDGADMSDTQMLLEYIRIADQLVHQVHGKTATRLEHLTYATIALAADDFVKIQSQPDDIEQDWEDSVATEFNNIRLQLEAASEETNRSDETDSDPDVMDCCSNFGELIRQRVLHQTRFAENGVRIRRDSKQNLPLDDSEEQKKPLTPRRRLIYEFDAILRLQQSHVGVTTGVGRFVRWLDGSQSTHATLVAKTPTRNSANAALAFDMEGDKTLKQRTDFYKKSGSPFYRTLGSASTSVSNKIEAGRFAFVLDEGKVFVGKVVLLYALKSGHHAAILESSNVACISNVCVQLFEHSFSHQFSAVPNSTSRFHTKKFALLRSISLLCLLTGPPKFHHAHASSTLIEVMPHDGMMYESLVKGLPGLLKAAKLSRKRAEKKEKK